MSQVRALINHKILRWARDSSGYSVQDAAEKIFGKKNKTGFDKLKRCEDGIDFLTFSQFEKAVSTYKRPIEVFYLPEVPKDIEKLPDFRGLQKIEYQKYPNLEFQIRRIRELRNIYIKLRNNDQFDWSFIGSINPNEEINFACRKIKEKLKLTDEELLQWKKDQVLKNLSKKIEDLSILVFKVPKIPSEIFGGFSLVEKDFPVIVINNQDYEARKVFTLIHELTHIFLGNSAICNPFEIAGVNMDPIEIFCNYIAGEFLVPSEHLLNHKIVRNHSETPIWSQNDLDILSNHFHISEEVILRRLLILNKTTSDFYQKKHIEFLAIYKEIKNKPKKEKSGGPLPEITYLSQMSLNFITTVLNAFGSNRIDQIEMLRFLDIGNKTYERLIHKLFG